MGFSTERVRLNELINSMETFLLKKIGDKRLVCYGASSLWPDIIRIIAIDDKVEFFVDRDSSRWGQEHCGIEIKSPEELRKLDKNEYSVVVLAGAVEEIGEFLENMGWEKNVNYFNIYQYIHINMEVSYSSINKFLRFLKTVPPEIKNVTAAKDSERIGIVLNAEGFNFGITYMPYTISLFLLLKWRGYDVKLIVDRLHWDGDIELYEGRCAVCDYIRDVVMSKLENFVSEDDILYIDAVGETELTLEDERECERIAKYSVTWSKWYNCWNSRFRTEKALQDDFAEIFKRNLSYINVFFEKNHFDTINAITALHKIAGVYYYAGKKRNIRVSSQDGVRGVTEISTNGPASYGGDIPRFLKEMWEETPDKEDILDRAKQMWSRRRGASTESSYLSYDSYVSDKRKIGYDKIVFQAPQKKAIQPYDVIIPLNLSSDAAALGVTSIFDDMKQWLEKTLDYVINQLNGTVLIREHPSGKILPPNMANSELYSVYPEILEPYKDSDSLCYVKSEEQLNLYQYMEQCKVLIPWTSTVGVEAGIMGKNVLVHTDAYYQDAAFVLRAQTEREYFELLKKCVTGDGSLLANTQLAHKEALLYFYYTMKRFLITDFTIVNSNYGAEWKFRSFEELLNAEGVEEIIQIVAENIPSVYLVEKQHRKIYDV